MAVKTHQPISFGHQQLRKCKLPAAKMLSEISTSFETAVIDDENRKESKHSHP